VPNPTATVLLCVRNGAATLEQQLRALSEQRSGRPWELLVVDNASTDASRAIAERWTAELPELRIVEERVAGLNRSRNRGVLAARSPLILCCDADDEVAPGWLQAMVCALERFDVVGAAMDTISLNPPGTPVVTCPQADGLPTVFGHHYVMGAALGFRREVFDAIGGFDELFDLGSDDTDFSLRAQYAGFSVGFEPRAVIKYRTRATMSSVMRQRFSYGRGHERLVAKHARLGHIESRPAQRWKGIVVGTGRLVLKSSMVASSGSRDEYLASAAHLAGRAYELTTGARHARAAER
jgi:glycosyltransferase involved in cell wall biosynthesis